MTRLAAIAVVVVAVCAGAGGCKREAPPSEGTTDQTPPRPLPPVKDTTGGQRAAQTPFQLAVAAPPATAGAPATVTVAVTPVAGYQLNLEYPYTKLKLTPPAGITAARAELVAADAKRFDKGELAFAVDVVAGAPGTHKLTGELQFAVCTSDESACIPQTRPVEVALEVR